MRFLQLVIDKKCSKKLIGLVIKNAREQKGLTQEELSASININQSNMSNIENGKNFPSFNTLCSLVEILNIAPNELLGFLNFSNNEKDALDIEILEYIKPFDKELKKSLIEIIKRIEK